MIPILTLLKPKRKLSLIMILILPRLLLPLAKEKHKRLKLNKPVFHQIFQLWNFVSRRRNRKRDPYLLELKIRKNSSKKDSTPEFEAAEQQIFDDDISFQVSNISDLKEHLFNDNDLEEPYQEKDLTEPSFLLSATNRSTEATGNGNSRLDSKMPLETSSSLTQAQSPPCLSILKDTQRANNFVKNSQNEQPDPKNTILQPTKRDTKQKIRSEKVREEMARNELFYQSQLLEKDKALHQKEKEIQLVDQEVQQLKQEVKTLDHGNLEMMKVVKEYERAISEVIADRERERVCHDIEKEKLAQERDQIHDDLRSAERAFNDVHRKYERTKEVIAGFKKNEDSLKARVSEDAAKLKKSEQRYEALRSHAEGKISEANETFESMQKNKSSEIAQLQAMLRKTEMRVNQQERIVEQKTQENIELTNICDELISKVGK